MWVVDHLDDLESDFSVFHRVDDITSLDGPRFFRMAMRIFAYDGVMAARLREVLEEPTSPQRPVQPQQQGAKNTSLSELRFSQPDLIERRVAHGR